MREGLVLEHICEEVVHFGGEVVSKGGCTHPLHKFLLLCWPESDK